MSDLYTLAGIYVAVALWRRGPQDLPAVGILLPLALAARVLIGVRLGEALPADAGGTVWLARYRLACSACWLRRVS